MRPPRCRRILLAVTFLASVYSIVRPAASAEPPSQKPAKRSEGAASHKPLDPALFNLTLEELERRYSGTTPPEGVRMLMAIRRGSKMGAGEGWFGPAETRYSWKWLANRHGIAAGETIPAEKFLGTAAWFARLDRNRDGRISEEDLDWSERNPWVQQAYLVNRLFRRIEANGDGKLTREEWGKFFEAAAGESPFLLSEDLRDALLSGNSGSFLPGDAPSPEMLIRGLLAGEVGSLHEGPRVDELAPDFSLKTNDGERTVRLTESLGKRPVVLVFGNFTCGPFRSMYPGVDEVSQRFKEEAVFLAVYVREAHPTDGWKMESNARVGVAVSQPRTYTERAAVATQCQRLLNPSIPLLVDEIDDSTGHAYSGMPARLYVIDREGKVAYKGGRGPFGFKSGEMEQALVMALLDQKTSRSAPAGGTSAAP